MTVNAVLQLAWSILLSCYGGTDDVVFGTTVLGPRRRPGRRRAGHRAGGINTLPVRVTLDRDRSVAASLRALHRTIQDVSHHSHLPPIWRVQR